MLTHDRNTIPRVLAHRAASDSDRPFILFVDHRGGLTSHTYDELQRRVLSFAAWLEQQGIRPGDRVALYMGNSVEFVVALLGIGHLGAICVPIVAQSSRDEVRYILGHSAAKGFVTTADRQDLALEVRKSLDQPPFVVAAGGDASSLHPDVHAFDGCASSGQPAAAATPEGTAMIMYTSGTTARPKGVMLSHRACLAAGQTTADHVRLRADDRHYCVLPLFHCNAMMFQFLPSLLTGATVVLGPTFSASRFWETVRAFRVSIINLTAGTVRLLLAAPPGPGDRAHAARLAMYGLPLTGEEIVAFETRFGMPLSMAWGLTESGACGTRTPLYADRRQQWQSIGQVSVGWQVRVVDEDGRDSPAGQTGELLIAGPGLTDGYYRDPSATAAALKDGWLYTGDLGWIDADGYVFFYDRKKDVIKPKGENVGASEIERVVRALPGVDDCAAIGVPDPILEERIKVFVQLLPGATLTSEVVIAHCRAHLASFKVPSEVELLSELPKTSVGKVRKGELRAEEIAKQRPGPRG
jgi:crotonobetaine/carnitine-CoA ligase